LGEVGGAGHGAQKSGEMTKNDHKQNALLSHADALNSILAVVEAVIERFNFARIIQRTCRGCKAA
jgi:hypothetical protein